jgi:sugar/nucleoside kinase (ribokinase family)
VTKDLWNYCPATEVEVASTAGAGDALLGGIIAALAAGTPLLHREPSEQKSPGPILTALELGVLLASYKCLSPHTIHPSACVETLIEFARDHGRPFSQQLQELLTIPTLA